MSDPTRTRKKLSVAAKGKTKGVAATPEAERVRRAKLSALATKRLEESPHIKWHEVDGVKVQGSWEKAVAERLLELGFRFSRPRLSYGGHRTYTPDFYLPDLELYIEVKGWLRKWDGEKMLLVLAEHQIDLRLLHGKLALRSFLDGVLGPSDLPRFSQMAPYPKGRGGWFRAN